MLLSVPARKALHLTVMTQISGRSPKAFVDTLRVIVQAQDDLTTHDARVLLNLWVILNKVPLECADFILSQESIHYSISQGAEDDTTIPILAEILSVFEGQPLRLEPLVRNLVRIGADLHARIPRRKEALRKLDSYGRLPRSTYGTPLDELFLSTSTPFEARAAADSWLRILASEGQDVKTYLKKEMDLHVMDGYFTWSRYTLLWLSQFRILRFDLGKYPSVWWDWYIDPSTSASELRREFDHIVMLDLYYMSHSIMWERMWPYEYQNWCDNRAPPDRDRSLRERLEWTRINTLAQDRANRRMKKKAAKAARAQGLKKNRSRIPGAWPA